MKKRIILISVFVLIAFAGMSQDRIVEIKTNMGNMKFRLFNDTPKHQNAFIRLANQGYYDQTLFYRVIENFLIQGGSKSSRNAPKGKRIGYGDPEHTVNDEILAHYHHKKGVLCAPRQPDEVNPFKQSDISQFFIVKGQVFTEGALDTMEMAINRPIKKEITQEIYTPKIKAQLKQLKADQQVDEFRQIANRVKKDIKSRFELHSGVLEFNEEQRKSYTTVGGYPDLDGKYTIFGECISGLEVIDKIAALKTDSNNRPYTDVKITVNIIQ